MAQKLIATLVDDLDGATADETVEFALDGVRFAIDLSEGNAEHLRGVFAQYIEHGRRTGGRVRRGRRAPGRTDPDDSGQIREWAQANGHEIAARGRIPKGLRALYDQAQQDEKAAGKSEKPTGTATKRRRRPRKT